jgi:hypothetical protein
MANIRLIDLPTATAADFNDYLMVFDGNAQQTKKITVKEMLGIAANTPCKYCGSTGKLDSRGNCGSCGAPLF